MTTSALICDPDSTWSNICMTHLKTQGFEVTAVANGKDAQVAIYQKKFSVVVLDIDTTAYSSMEVLRYIKCNAPSIPLMITVKSKERLEQLELERSDLRKLGAIEIFFKPYNPEQIIKALSGEFQFLYANRDADEEKIHKEVLIDARDDEFTRIKINEFYSGNVTVFDLFVRINANKFLKILHRGDYFSEDRIKKYREEKKAEFLYFRTQDRLTYIKFVNELATKLITDKHIAAPEKIKMLKSVTEKYIEDIYTKGPEPRLVDEGIKICDNIHAYIMSDKSLASSMKQMEEFDPAAYTHAFLVTFFSSILCSKLEWASGASIEKVATGAMLHDIGKLKIDKRVGFLDVTKIDKTLLPHYYKHPLEGAEMLAKFPTIHTAIKQIVLQHHERRDGSGFPNALTNLKIYPLAQIVGFIDDFVCKMVREKTTPINTLKALCSKREELQKFDLFMVKTFIGAFLEHDITLEEE